MTRPFRDALIVFGVAWAIYAIGCADTVQGGDAGEFATLAALGGVAHPPGYPLFSALSRLFAAVLPFGSYAWRASVFSAGCSAAALALLFLAVRGLTERRDAALLAAAALGWSGTFWWRATVVDVLAMGALTAALILTVAVRAVRGERGPLQGLLLGLAVATGVANHLTVIWTTPLCVWTLWASLPRRDGALQAAAAARTLGACVLGLVPGFLLYGLLLLPDQGWRWGDLDSLSQLVRHMLRADYGTLSLAVDAEPVPLWLNPLTCLVALAQDFALVGVFALLGFLALVRDPSRRGFGLALAASFLLAGPAFLALAKTAPRGLGALVLSRFYLLPATLAALAIGAGYAALLTVLPPARRRAARALCALALAAPVLLYGERAHHRGWTVLEDYAQNLLTHLEPDALVIGNGDAIFGAVLYLQHVKALAPGVTYVEPGLLSLPWYRARLRARDPRLVLPDAPPAPPPEVIAAHAGLFEREPKSAWIAGLAWANRARRPVYLATRHWRLRPQLPPLYPSRALALKVGEARDPQALLREHVQSLGTFVSRSGLSTRDRAERTFEAEGYHQYGLTFLALSSYAKEHRRPDVAAEALSRAAALDPWLLRK